MEHNGGKTIRILSSETILGSSDMTEYFETALVPCLKTYFNKTYGQILNADIENQTKDLLDLLNFFLEPDANFEDNQLGLELSTVKIKITDELTLDVVDYGVISEYSDDFMWYGLLKMECGQHIKIWVEGNYYVENMFY